MTVFCDKLQEIYFNFQLLTFEVVTTSICSLGKGNVFDRVCRSVRGQIWDLIGSSPSGPIA